MRHNDKHDSGDGNDNNLTNNTIANHDTVGNADGDADSEKIDNEHCQNDC